MIMYIINLPMVKYIILPVIRYIINLPIVRYIILPMVVAVPPMFADMHTDMASIALMFFGEICDGAALPLSASASFGSVKTSDKTASRIGIIMAEDQRLGFSKC